MGIILVILLCVAFGIMLAAPILTKL